MSVLTHLCTEPVFTFSAPSWTLLDNRNVIDLIFGYYRAACLLKVGAVPESHHPPVYNASVGRIQGHYTLTRVHCEPLLLYFLLYEWKQGLKVFYPAVWLSLSDSICINKTKVAHVVLQAALIQSFQSWYLLLLHSHNKLPKQKFLWLILRQTQCHHPHDKYLQHLLKTGY